MSCQKIGFLSVIIILDYEYKREEQPKFLMQLNVFFIDLIY